MIDPFFLANSFVTLLVITDPGGVVPVFLAIMADATAAERRRAAWQAVVVAAVVIATFALVVPFGWVRRGFYSAARDGLAAQLPWPPRPGGPAEAVPAAELARRLLPVAHRGLVQAGVAEGEAGRLLEVVAARVGTGQTGAVWQRSGLLALRRRYGPQRALEVLLARYLELAGTGRPVHRWPPAAPATMVAGTRTRHQSRVADALAGGARR